MMYFKILEHIRETSKIEGNNFVIIFHNLFSIPDGFYTRKLPFKKVHTFNDFPSSSRIFNNIHGTGFPHFPVIFQENNQCL